MNTTRSVAIAAVFFLVCLSCSGLKPWTKEQGKRDQRTKAEKSFDPWEIEKEDPIVVRERSSKVGEESSPGIKEEDQNLGTTVNHQTIYRIQIFASKFPQEAQELADSVESCFSKPARIDYEVPYYKVKLGDFDTLEEAESFLRLIRKRGFPQAWVVKTRKAEREEDDRD